MLLYWEPRANSTKYVTQISVLFAQYVTLPRLATRVYAADKTETLYENKNWWPKKKTRQQKQRSRVISTWRFCYSIFFYHLPRRAAILTKLYCTDKIEVLVVDTYKTKKI